MAKVKRIELVADTNLDTVMISADRELMQQAYASLVENAVRYAADRTSVRIFLYGSDGLSCTVCVQNVGLHVEDNEREKIFEAGYRAAKARERAPLGSGVGLTTARAILRLHRGEISVKSVPEGSGPGLADVRFYVESPLTGVGR